MSVIMSPLTISIFNTKSHEYGSTFNEISHFELHEVDE